MTKYQILHRSYKVGRGWDNWYPSVTSQLFETPEAAQMFIDETTYAYTENIEDETPMSDYKIVPINVDDELYEKIQCCDWC